MNIALPTLQHAEYHDLTKPLTFCIHDAKDCMRVAAKDQMVIESAALHSGKLTTQKLKSTTIIKNCIECKYDC